MCIQKEFKIIPAIFNDIANFYLPQPNIIQSDVYIPVAKIIALNFVMKAFDNMGAEETLNENNN